MKSCSQCLLTDADYPEIQFNDFGKCDICLQNEGRLKSVRKISGQINQLMTDIKAKASGKYDCIIGISGGTDSSYLVHLAKSYDLNPLLVHIDSGWNSEISVINIHNLVQKSGFDLYTVVLPWKEFKDVQRSFVLANVMDIDLPFDNAMLYYNYSVAKKFGVKYILNGYSSKTEGLLPPSWTHFKYDRKNIRDIHKKFGILKLENLKFLSPLRMMYFDRIHRIKFVNVLDRIDYKKGEAKKVIKEQFDWSDYGGKHYESVFTRFYQGYILPNKFGIDKRKSHFSMLILNGELTQKEALEQLSNDKMYPSEQMLRDDHRFFLKKLELDENWFTSYINRPGVSNRNFASELDLYDSIKPFYRKLKKIIGLKVFKE